MAFISHINVDTSTLGKDIRAVLMCGGLLSEKDFYMVHNGHIVCDTDIVEEGKVHIFLRLLGGKGGFGSMLRAIGAQIEKTTNREACRDLSGRRLRDINEEQRLKNWIALQADRERETVERRKKRLERLQAEPKHEFKDKNYDKERSELTDKVNDAVEQGFKLAASGSGIGQKRKNVTASTATSSLKKKKSSLLWMDADEADLSSCDDSDDSLDACKVQKKEVPTSCEEQSKEATCITTAANTSSTTQEVSLDSTKEEKAIML